MNTVAFFNTHSLGRFIASAGLGLCLALVATQGLTQTLPQIVEDQELPSLAPIIDRVAPAVVNISVRGSVETNNQLSQDPFFRRFVPPDASREVQRAGS